MASPLDLLDLGPRDAARYTVVYINSEKSSFISLPGSLASRLRGGFNLPVPVAIAVAPTLGLPAGPSIFLSWAGTSCDIGTIGIPAPVARIFDLPPGVQVTISPLAEVPQAVSVTLEPASPDDWEILELNAELVEAHLLSQCGVAAAEQPLCVWVHGQLLQLKASATDPAAPVVKLVNGSEMHVAPRLRPTNGTMAAGKKEDGGVKEAPTIRTSLRALVQPMASTPKPAAKGENGLHGGDAPAADEPLPVGVYEALVSPLTLQRSGLKDGAWVALSAPRGGLTHARIWSSPSVPPGHLALPEGGLIGMAAERFDSIRLRTMNSFEKDLISQRDNSSAFQKKAGQPFAPPMAFSSNGSSSGSARDAASGGATGFAIKVPPSQREAATKLMESLLPVVAAGPRSVLQSWGAPRPGGVLLCGPAGSGKTSLLRATCSLLSSHPQCLAAIHTIPCRELSPGPGAVQRIMGALSAAVARMPSIIVFEDLDVLCPGGVDHDPALQHAEEHPELVGMAAWLCEALDGMASADEQWLPARGISTSLSESQGVGVGAWPPVAVVATCREAAAVAPMLRVIGRLDTTVTLAPATAESRADILEAAAAVKGCSVDRAALVAVAAKADAFDGADLSVLLDRAMGVGVGRWLQHAGGFHGESPLRLEESDLLRALAGMTPAAFWGTGTRSAVQSGVQGWEDVGGMSVVRAALQESLELPLKHAALVASAPLRLRTGVLLYGPPGCGKTHIVAAAVAATGARCITVSGPELLNKYIGASEAGVRDVFRRAAAAAPSVLFFDEFDAIAPHRGHDNTGVTDRVVNQLLTELDGVGGLKGVCVVAATSRPDLIDAALLRPGRLDRHLLCAFPCEAERAEILEALSRRLPMADDVHFEGISAAAEGFSGADLGAVLSEAQLAAAHEALEAFSLQNGGGAATGSGGASVVLKQRHLEAALEAARPSVSTGERARLDDIYSRFEGGGGGQWDVDRPLGPDPSMKKVSWA